MSSFVLDPRKDLQEQLRPSVHTKMSTLMRPHFQNRSETSSPTSMVTSDHELKRRKDAFIPLTPKEFRQKAHDEERLSLASSSSSPSSTRRSPVPSHSSPATSRSSPLSPSPSSPVFTRLSDPKQFSGVYRRRSMTPGTSINHATSLSMKGGCRTFFPLCHSLMQYLFPSSFHRQRIHF